MTTFRFSELSWVELDMICVAGSPGGLAGNTVCLLIHGTEITCLTLSLLVIAFNSILYSTYVC